MTSKTPAEIAAHASAKKSCGTCGLWGYNFYTHRSWIDRGNTCCADAVMDLPASFIPARQTMRADQGAECICWEPIE